MPIRRAIFLTVLACLSATAPASASERSEARRYAAAMQPVVPLTPAEGEAMIATYEARAAHIAATCLASARKAMRRDDDGFVILMLYSAHVGQAAYLHEAAWMLAADDRLRAIPTRSRTLRRGRAARHRFSRFARDFAAAAPVDFCALVTGWEANGYEGVPPGGERLLELMRDADRHPGLDRRLRRAKQTLARHGATRAQLRAFAGNARLPDHVRMPADDPVIPDDMLAPPRGAARRSGADAG